MGERTLDEDGYCVRCGVPDAFCWCEDVTAPADEVNEEEG
jgi:hypothetical protein